MDRNKGLLLKSKIVFEESLISVRKSFVSHLLPSALFVVVVVVVVVVVINSI